MFPKIRKISSRIRLSVERRPVKVFVMSLLCGCSIFLLGCLLNPQRDVTVQYTSQWDGVDVMEGQAEGMSVMERDAPSTETPSTEIPTTEEPSRVITLNATTVWKIETNTKCLTLKMVPGGKPICIDTKDKFIGQAIEETGVWEKPVWNAMLKMLVADRRLCLIDVGANIGVFTVNVAALGRRVVAVEAFYENIQRMSESLRLGGLAEKVTIVHNAVSDVYEDVFLWRPDDNSGATKTLYKGVTLGPNKPAFLGDHNSVSTIYLEDLTDVIPCKKAVMKIDISGHEEKAFRKIGSLLDDVNITAIFMPWTFVKASDDCVNIARIMTLKGYVPNSLNFKPLTGSTRSDVRRWPSDIVWMKKWVNNTQTGSMVNSATKPKSVTAVKRKSITTPIPNLKTKSATTVKSSSSKTLSKTTILSKTKTVSKTTTPAKPKTTTKPKSATKTSVKPAATAVKAKGKAVVATKKS